MSSTMWDVTVDGQQVANIVKSTKAYPIVMGAFTIYRDATSRVAVVFSGGTRLLWNFAKRVRVSIPTEQKGTTCGVCGNFDDNAYNDYVYGPSGYDPDCPNKSSAMNTAGVSPGESVQLDDKSSLLYGFSWHSYSPPSDVACKDKCG